MRILNRLKAFSHTLETNIEVNLYRRKEQLQTLTATTHSKNIEGYFSIQGASAFIKKHPNIEYKQIKLEDSVSISPIGVGTYRGSMDATGDLPMFNGLVDSVNTGVNMIDSCRNFRKGRSEATIGKAVRYLCQNEGYDRSSLFIGSKAGYVFEELPKGVTSSDVVNDHCVHPSFIKAELQKSRQSLGLSTLDVYYLNNFAECQMQKLGKKEFEERLAKAFETLEKARSEGKIRHFGLSSWQAFRVGEGKPAHLSLHSVMRIAEKVAGKSHGMKFVQLPINIMMPEAFADKYIEGRSFLDVAQELDLNVVSSSPLLSGSLINIPMPADLLKCNNNGAKHLQLVRSIPSKALICTLVGQQLNRHVRKNLQVLFAPRLDEGEWLNVFVPKSEAQSAAGEA